MAYDKKYRERVICYVQEGHTQGETSIVFDVGTSTIKRWFAEYKATGTPGGGYRTGKRHAKKTHPEKLAAYMEAHPDALLKEVAKELSCCVAAVSKALARDHYTRKKRSGSTKSVTKKSDRLIAKR